MQVDISNSLLKGTIPYALTSDLDVTKDAQGNITGMTYKSTDSLNPIFLAYDVEDGAWVMAYEEEWISQQANKNQARSMVSILQTRLTRIKAARQLKFLKPAMVTVISVSLRTSRITRPASIPST